MTMFLLGFLTCAVVELVLALTIGIALRRRLADAIGLLVWR